MKFISGSANSLQNYSELKIVTPKCRQQFIANQVSMLLTCIFHINMQVIYNSGELMHEYLLLENI